VTRSFIASQPGTSTLERLEPSSREDIVRMAKAAGLQLPDALMNELCTSFPAFEAMVRRLPRARNRFDEPAHHLVQSRRMALADPDGDPTAERQPETPQHTASPKG
jgi:hypothetical protein